MSVAIFCLVFGWIPIAAELPTQQLDSERVTVGDLMHGLAKIALELETNKTVKAEFEDLVKSHSLEGSNQQFLEFVRVRLAFETTRDGGLWGIRWTITNRDPNSIDIWYQFSQWTADEIKIGPPTADAECDELSALCAVVARRLGVKGVGLFWPTPNHTVAVWETQGLNGKKARILLPTSQIFLGRAERLGSQSFDPWQQKRIYPYEKKDVSDGFQLPSALVRALLEHTRLHAGKSSADLQAMRNERTRKVGGS